MEGRQESIQDRCEHVMQHLENRQPFEKRTFKTPLSGKASLHYDAPCIFCNNIYPFWADHVKDPHVEQAFDKGVAEPFPTETLDTSAIKVVVQKGQIGEVYHVLLCRLLQQWNRKATPIDIDVQLDPHNDEIPELLRWYQINFNLKEIAVDDRGEISRGSYDSKKGATRYVTSTFEACHTRLRTQRKAEADVERCFEDIQPSVWPDQATIFNCFRAMLDPIYGWPNKTDGTAKLVDIHADYFRPSYSAKYWLNRYLRLTGQKILPKESEVTRLAVIHCRLHAGSNVKRVMNKKFITEIWNAINIANARAEQAEEKQFSHVILYGDFTASEGLSLKADLMNPTGKSESADQYRRNPMQVIYISRPWIPRDQECQDEDNAETNREVRLFWKKMRNSKFDPLPFQVKILTIWIMLCKRYSPKICVIGHRSGFIEGAALIGIPVFYLNNERSKAIHPNAGDILWKPIEKQTSKRLPMLAEFMNTLIPLDVLGDVDKELDTKYKDELMTALFTFMCCDLKPSRHQFSTHVPHPSLSYGTLPGWTGRVEMMHDKCEQRHSGSCVDMESVEQVLAFYKRVVPDRGYWNDPDRNEAERTSFWIGGPPTPIQAAVPSRYSVDVNIINEFLQNRGDDYRKNNFLDVFTEYCGHRKEWPPDTGQEWIRRRHKFAMNTRLEPRLLLQMWVPTAPGQAPALHQHDGRESRRYARALAAGRATGAIRGPEDSLWIESTFDPNKSTVYCIQKMRDYLPSRVTSDGHLQPSRHSIPLQVKYACVQWIDHFVIEKITDPWIVAQFLRKHFLHWVETLSVLKRLSDTVETLDALIETLEHSPFLRHGQAVWVDDTSGMSSLIDFVRDGKAYIQFNTIYIQQHPLDSHKAALRFAPTKSLIRQHFRSEVDSWGAQVSGTVGSEAVLPLFRLPWAYFSIGNVMTFSSDGSKVASLSCDKILRVWSVASGFKRLKGDHTKLTAFVFATDGKRLIVAPEGTPIRTWKENRGKVDFHVIGHIPWCDE
jgi:hypothetical protein